MKDNTEPDTETADRSALEALFKGLQASLRREARKVLPVLMPDDDGTEKFRENSLERLYFAKQNAGTIPRGSVVLIPQDLGGPGA